MKKFCAILLLLISLGGYAQIKFESGYIILTNGSKTECFIKNSDWRSTPESFNYKLSENGETLKATTDNTKEISVGGTTFTRFTVNIDRSSDELSSLTTNSEPVISRETVFLKLLVKGDATLYKYYDGTSLRFFYTTAETEEPIALICKMYRGDNNKILYNKMYKSALQKLMAVRVNEPTLYKNLEYKDNDMIALFKKYNGITNEEVKNDTPSLKGELHLKAGAELRNISLSANFGTSGSSAYDFGNKTIPAFGAELEWIMPFNRNKWGIFLAPYYHNYKNSGSKTVGTGASTIQHKWEASYSALEFSLGGRYYAYLSDKTKLFINGGYVFSKAFNNSGLKYQRVADGATTLTIAATTKQQSGIFAGAGFAYKSISGEIRYHAKHSINGSYGGWTSDYSGFGLLVQYSIF